MYNLKTTFTALSIGLASISANASFINDDAHFAHHWPTVGEENQATDLLIGNSLEYTIPGYYTVDVNEAGIDVSFINNVHNFGDADTANGQFGGFIINGLNDSSGDDISGISNFSAVGEFAEGAISFGSDWVSLSFDNLHANLGDSIHFDIDLSDSVSVPAPAGSGLMAFSLMLLFTARRFVKSAC